MNKAFKLLVLFIFPSIGFSQNTDSTKWSRFPNAYDNPYKPFQAKRIIDVRASAILSANKISNDFIYPFLFGDRLEKSTITRTIDRGGVKNISLETNLELLYVDLKHHFKNNKNLSWYLKAGNHQRTHTKVTNDAMRLIFKGNTDPNGYAFDDCSFYNLRLNKFGGGVYYHREKKLHPFNISFGLYILQALNYGYIQTNTGNFLQGNEDSFKIGLNYKARFASAGSFSGDGLGAGAELMFNQKINKNSNWGLRLENFGFANFNNQTTTYESSGVYNWTGIFIPDVGRINEEGYFKTQLDSLTDPWINKMENQSKNIWIAPVSYLYFVTHRSSGYYQIAMRHMGTKASPILELRYFNFVKPNLMLGTTLGTLGNFYLNTDLNWSIRSRLMVQLGIYHIEALILPKKAGGLGGNMGLSFVF